MNQLDLFLGALLMLFALSGLLGGAVHRVIQIAALLIGFREAWRVAPYLEHFLGGSEGGAWSGWGFLIPLLSFAVVYLIVRLLGSWVGSLAQGGLLRVLNHLLGLALGLLVGVYLLGYGCLLYEAIFPSQHQHHEEGAPVSARESSRLYPLLIHAVQDIGEVRERLFPADSSSSPAPATPTHQL